MSIFGDAVDGVKGFVSDPIGTITAPFGGGDPSGNDGGSSNWAAWGHEEMRSMLDTTVTPEDINEGARKWSDLRGEAVDLVRTSTGDLRRTVFNGWRGKSAEAAIRSLDPVDEWTNSLSAAMSNTAQLMDVSGSAAGQAKATVPPAQSHDWGESLTSFATGGGPGALVDAVAQDRAQEEARMEAVRIMNTAYSAPINESRAAVPTYPQLVDPTLQPSEHHPGGGPAPGPGGTGGGGVPGGGVPTGVPGGGTPAPRIGSYHPPAATHAQNVPGRPGSSGSPSPTPPQYTGPRSPGGPGGPGVPGGGGPGGRFGPDASAGVPFAPLGGASAGGDAAAPRRGFRGAGLGGGRPGGLGGLGGRAGAGSGSGAGFGPRGSGAASAAEGGRIGSGPGGAGAAGGRGGAGAAGAPLAGGGAGRGQGGEDNEHRRPSYLVDTDDIFGDGRKVAPPVIGEDPPEYYR